MRERLITKEKKIVDIAEGEIKKFVKAWEKNPYLWESEADVHAELYMNIKSSLRRKKFCPVETLYKNYMEDYEYFNWVYCKPKTYIKREKYAYYPDIVIYKQKNKKEIRNVKEKENDPMLWVCEIKYMTDWSGLITEKNIKKDINKLKKLLKQEKGGTDYACCLILRGGGRCKGKKNHKKNLKREEIPNGKLKQYNYSFDYEK